MNVFPSPAVSYFSHVMMFCALTGLGYAFRQRLTYYFKALVIPDEKDAKNKYQRDLLLIGLAAGGTVTAFIIFLGLPGFVAVAMGLIAGLVTPFWVKNQRKARYVRAFDGALAESLATVSSSLRAGLTLRDSLEVSAENCDPAFAHQATFALKEYRFGVSIEQALDNIRQRVPTKNCNIAFGAMIISSRLGGRLPEILKEIVVTIRERERVEGKLQALTAQGRAQAAILMVAPPLMFIGMYFYDRSKVELLTDYWVGQILLTLAIVLEVIGIVVTRKIMKLEV